MPIAVPGRSNRRAIIIQKRMEDVDMGILRSHVRQIHARHAKAIVRAAADGDASVEINRMIDAVVPQITRAWNRSAMRLFPSLVEAVNAITDRRGKQEDFDPDAFQQVTQRVILNRIPLYRSILGKPWVAVTTATLQNGLAEGLGVFEVSRRLTRAVDNLSRVQSDRISRTEVHHASNVAQETIAAGSSIEFVAKEWAATSDARTRDDHLEANGQRVPPDGLFDVGGASMQYPGDPAGGAGNTINCRCAVLWHPE